MSLGRTKPGNEDPSLSSREGGGIGWLSFKPPNLYAHHIVRMAGGQLTEKHKVPTYLKQWREQPLGAFVVWANEHHQDVHMPSMGMLQGVVVVQPLMAEPPLVNMASRMEPERIKHTP